MVKGHDAMLAIDVGGTNIRAGVVQLNLKKQSDLSKACVLDMKVWPHRDKADLTREDAVGELTKMSRISSRLPARATSGSPPSLSVAPVPSARTGALSVVPKIFRATGRTANST
jgi:hypothetical protein